MGEKKPLSQYGIGPYYAASIFALTLGALILNRFGILPVIVFRHTALLCKLLGPACILAGAFMWFNAVIAQKIAQHIRQNELVTTGAYAWVRNPIYSALMLMMWGLLIFSGNLLLLVLCPVYHILMTVMVKNTEEKWLKELYGKAYLNYCKKVNRCIPWFPKQGRGKK